MTEFIFEGALYGLEISAEEWKKKRNEIFVKLPNEKIVQAQRWLPTKPPMISVMTLVEYDSTHEAVLLKEAPPPRVLTGPLRIREIRELLKEQRLIFQVRITLDDILCFTYNGLRDYLEEQYVCCDMQVTGHIKDMKFKIIDHSETDLVLQINCDSRFLI